MGFWCTDDFARQGSSDASGASSVWPRRGDSCSRLHHVGDLVTATKLCATAGCLRIPKLGDAYCKQCIAERAAGVAFCGCIRSGGELYATCPAHRPKENPMPSE